MQNRIQSILEAENDAKKIIQDALNKVSKEKETAQASLSEMLHALDEDMKSKLNQESEDLKQEAKNEYSGTIAKFSVKLVNIEKINIESEASNVSSLFLQSIS